MIFRTLITFFLHNLKSSSFLGICENIERKIPSKSILEFLKHFSSSSHHKLFFGPPCIYMNMYAFIICKEIDREEEMKRIEIETRRQRDL